MQPSNEWTMFMLFASPSIIAVFSLWYYRSCAEYSSHSAQIDQLFRNCQTQPVSENSSIAIVIPFPKHQMWNVLALLYVWSLPDFYPIRKDGSKKRAHLVLYPSQFDDDHINALNEFISSNDPISQMISEAFLSFSIFPRNLSDRFDVYYRDYVNGQWISPGTTEMFYPMITDYAVGKYSYVIYNEPDMFPLRPGWLSQAQDLLFSPDADFWIMGSQQRQKKVSGGRLHSHINGNMIVRVENKCVRGFFGRVYKEFRYLPYDTSIMRYLVSPKHVREAQHILQRMRYTDFIGNFGDSPVTKDALIDQYPDMYLVHGRGYQKNIGGILKLERIRAGVPNIVPK